MVDQTSVGSSADGTGNGQASNSFGKMKGGVSGLAHDLSNLAALHLKLLQADLREMASGAGWPAACIVAGLCLLLAALVLLLFSLASLLQQAFGLSPAAGQGLSALIGGIVAAVLAQIGWYRLRHKLSAIRRSQEELRKNVHWLRGLLSPDGETSQPSRGPREEPTPFGK